MNGKVEVSITMNGKYGTIITHHCSGATVRVLKVGDGIEKGKGRRHSVASSTVADGANKGRVVCSQCMKWG
jgi:hypothetical protein